MNSKYLLYVQLALIVLMFYFGNLSRVFESGILSIIFIIGTTIGLWAYYNMGSKNFSPFPEPKKGAKLAQKGIYKYIRHPMYSGIMLVALSLFLSNLQFLSFTILALLCYVLDMKATTEEDFLIKLHQEYKEYVSKTKKFIPRLY